MSILTNQKSSTNSLSNEEIYIQKPYGYLTLPDPAKPNEFELRTMFLLDHTYSTAPSISQSSSGAIHYVDIDLGTQTGTTTENFVTEEINVIKASGEERLVVRLKANEGRGTEQVGEVTLFFVESDDEVLSDFGPSAYIVNTPDADENTAISALIPLVGYVISNTDIAYNSEHKTYEITIDVAIGSGSDPLEYSIGLDMDEVDSAEIVVKKGGSGRGKVDLEKKYADDE